MKTEVISEFVCEYAGSRDIETRIVPLRGGLDSCGTARVELCQHGGIVSSFVVKHVAQHAARELHVYRALEGLRTGVSTAKLLGWHDSGRDGMYMFLEWVAPSDPWPWKNAEAGVLVI